MLLAVLGTVADGVANEQNLSGFADDTMLMFVGEEKRVTTVASRFPEAPTTAPAVVSIVSREEIETKGYQTLAELLADQPGFYIAANGRGSVPYLRGLRDSVLFLYDGVPMTTDVTKNFAPLDREISLAAVARVEIVRGPGSILWGPDAFAGVVNIVPLRGAQQAINQAGLLAGSDDLMGAHLSSGVKRQHWDGFLSLNGVRERDYDPDYMVWQDDAPLMSDEVDRSEYAELVGTLNYDNWLHISGRWSDFTRRYTMRNATENIIWEGKKEAPVNHLKVTASQVIGPSHYTLTGYYQEADYKIRDADIERKQRNKVFHAELLWDRRIFDRGLITAGASWRRNAVDDALVRDGFLPELLPPDLPVFVPRIEQEDFVNRLKSAFAQFRYQWGKSSWWIGGRLDDYSQYESTLSYSLGFLRPIGDDFHFKASYGTAYRSPYSSQLYDDLDFDPESIRTASAQLTWQPDEDHLLELTLFHSRLKDHRVEDPYGGLSLPDKGERYGLELSGMAPLSPSLVVNGNFTALNDNSGDENFSVLKFCFVRPDGSQVCVYDNWDQPSDTGPTWIAQLGLNWRIAANHSLAVGARIAGHFDYSYKKDQVDGSYSQPLLVDLNYRRPGFFSGRDTISLRISNLFDRDYQQPDVYGPVDGPPLKATLSWNYKF